MTAVSAGVLVFALAACSSGGTSGGSAAPATSGMSTAMASPGVSGTQIVISNFAYTPMDLTVSPGQKVTVVNHDSTAHTLTAATGGAFDTGSIAPGASGSFTAPAKPGSYRYICSIHQFMHGTVTVR
ncbi:cupredoxin domain-containing protein [Streptacidiphilus sp. PB12-B1b]|uniref:cupredoxin domain-containing protein n=1 Tax=Streptacidiphilus sp. PB12-B1b TaxID=2705012 RepID=UPI001CDB7807|nr:cupredoxin domain-containing protein [Streptacidiphilus sp. PB12-B1b]